MNITLFEKTGRIGGRTLTINAFEDPNQRVEQGASIFVPSNQILFTAMTQFGLSPSPDDPNADPNVGIWDGDCFVFTLDQSAPSWWNTLKVTLKYGLTAPQRAQDLTIATISNFLRIYNPPFFPFKSLTQRAQEMGLSAIASVTGEQFLNANNVSTSPRSASRPLTA